jgi:hypothetical protein
VQGCSGSGTIHTTLHFICNLQMGPKKLGYLSLASLSSLLLYNTLAYWAPCRLERK